MYIILQEFLLILNRNASNKILFIIAINLEVLHYLLDMLFLSFSNATLASYLQITGHSMYTYEKEGYLQVTIFFW